MKYSLLVATLVIGALLGLPSESLARDVLVFVDGSRMEVKSYEVKERVVQFVTPDGKLRSVPRTYVNLPATQGGQSAHPAPAEPTPPPRRPTPPPPRPAPAPEPEEPMMSESPETPEMEPVDETTPDMPDLEPEPEPEPEPPPMAPVMPAPEPVAPPVAPVMPEPSPAPAPPPGSSPAPFPVTPPPNPEPAPMSQPSPVATPPSPDPMTPAPAATPMATSDINPPSWSDSELRVSLIAPSAQWQIKEMPASFDVAVSLTNPSTEARATLALIRQKMRSKKDFERILAEVESSVSSAPGYRSLSNGIVDLPPYTAHEFRFMKDVGFVGTFNQLVVVYSRDLAYVLSMTCPEQRMRESTGDFQAIIRGLNIEKSPNDLTP